MSHSKKEAKLDLKPGKMAVRSVLSVQHQWALKYFVSVNGDITRGCISANAIQLCFKFQNF